MDKWLKALVIGYLQNYLTDQLVTLKNQVQKTVPGCFPASGGIQVEPGRELVFLKAVLKGLLWVMQHGD